MKTKRWKVVRDNCQTDRVMLLELLKQGWQVIDCERMYVGNQFVNVYDLVRVTEKTK